MSDAIKHECGIAMIRLRKSPQYYIDKYGTAAYASNRMYVLMQKQINRGQDGAGVANVKIDTQPGTRYISRYRSVEPSAVNFIFDKINKKYKKAKKIGGHDALSDAEWLKENIAFTGEVWLGHLRYGTHGENSIETCHPFLKQNNWRSRNLVMAGNFNMTNVEELFGKLVQLGQHPKEKTDTVTVMEKIGHFLDEENQRIFDKYKHQYSNEQITHVIENELDVARILRRSCRDFDGGYAMAGLIGNGSSFVVRDPSGIRPAYYYADDEVIVVASEKPAIKSAFDIDFKAIKEIQPGHALVINKDGSYAESEVMPAREKKSCSFERIYFSRGTDPDIYQERKSLGKALIPQILKAIDFDLKNTVFSYIPNTAETAFLGMIEGLEDYLVAKRKEVFLEGKPHMGDLEELLNFRPRVEKLVSKDVKLRTFITNDDDRDVMVSSVYDTTYEVIKPGVDTLVVIDDSIVRGTTLEKSILTTLDKLSPKRIIIVSSAPQIRFPDCYGIDMSRMKEFIAFRAALALLKERKLENILDETYEACIANPLGPENFVKRIYESFADQEVSDKIAEIVTTPEIKAEVKVIYQTVENLHKCTPNHIGDWYFTGDYPTTGGTRVVNRAFVNFMEGKTVRAY
ncbi:MULTISPECIES: amidophosphoribosyltransferase [unclassified Algoriphagus]|jgi:amidophosphoribosyltransferase|uniref:amidophosphoribosyltransferase n=1 Tax=unclassified Algoriphagus TaxID=2641541 RepID=UPI000C4312DD|nr:MULTISPECIES: amidophosphoribosyltransferase [unclassified Algoriphagus]MAL15168.1 amidophosphoribosyltransferase [Algoriphagus sp.]QYH37796.1 amidophosphoribosyltransferase [Algoriphagus sp. NBT04N3]HAS57229.1 amidophosphoribosyltransferase [Algoriphagus sp.]HCH44146.1 amidophosphoribosyltransferase [Algoriphagus sp.]